MHLHLLNTSISKLIVKTKLSFECLTRIDNLINNLWIFAVYRYEGAIRVALRLKVLDSTLRDSVYLNH